MDTVFFTIGLLASVSIFIAIYFANFRSDYIKAYAFLALAMLIINFGWLVLIAS